MACTSVEALAWMNYDETKMFTCFHAPGRKYADAPLRKDMESWPFKVIADKDGKPMVVVEQNGKETRCLWSSVHISNAQKMNNEGKIKSAQAWIQLSTVN